MLVCQLMHDFVCDCLELVFAFFSDPSRVARLADPLEEEVVHHAAILQRCNTSNANLADVPASQISSPTCTTMMSIPSVITGQLMRSTLSQKTTTLKIFVQHKTVEANI